MSRQLSCLYFAKQKAVTAAAGHRSDNSSISMAGCLAYLKPTEAALWFSVLMAKQCLLYSQFRGVSCGWAIAHPVFGRIESAAGRRRGGSGAPHYYLPTQF